VFIERREVDIMTLELSDREREVLKNILELSIGELRDEIVKTDSPKYRAILHDEEDTIKQIIKRL
jgi:hypothetical protein